VLKGLPGLVLSEMKRSGPAAVCCGVGAYSSCDAFTKLMQNERLHEAAAAAPVLVTACPHCRIHLTCYLDGTPIEEIEDLDIVDLTTLVAESLA
jgi:Fe-S oxidoreductase